MPDLPTIDHMALTVTDLDASTSFYSQLWGVSPSGTMDDGPFTRRIFALGRGLTLGLTQHEGSSDQAFNAKAPGLDHLGFFVAGREELIAWSRHLETIGVDHSGLVEAAYGTAVSFKDPDGIALEFFAPAS